MGFINKEITLNNYCFEMRFSDDDYLKNVSYVNHKLVDNVFKENKLEEFIDKNFGDGLNEKLWAAMSIQRMYEVSVFCNKEYEE